MSCYGVCCCWRKRKTDPPDLAHPTIKPPDSSPLLIRHDPSVQTGKEPSSSSHRPFEEPSSTSPTLEEVLKSFADTDIHKADDFINAIHEHLNAQHTPSTSSSNTDKLSNWAPFIQSGAAFLNFASEHAEKIDTKGGFSDGGQVTKIAGDILQQIGQVHWAVAGISIVGYLISKSQKVSQNRTECADLLKDMLKLASHIKHLHDMPLENESKNNLKSAFQYIVEGSVCCACQLDTGYFFSFLKTSINSDTLSGIRSKIDRIYQNDLQVIIGKETLQTEQEMSLQLKEMSARQPDFLPLSLPAYPRNAVGIEEQLKAVNTLLNMNNNEDQSSTSVVIWGFGGIGKTTLANAAVSTIDRESYNYARIELDQDSDKNNYKAMQEQILKDAFPRFNGGREVKLRDDSDGRDKLAKAFQTETNKPVFLFIDNALHKEDLEKILPEDLQGLPQRSRLLITTRILNVTDVLQERGIRRKDYPVKTLSDSHAAEVLCSDSVIRDRIEDDIEKMVKLCGGIPLVLKIVGARLLKQNYDVKRCTQIREALESGGNIKDNKLSNRLFHFVYDQLEESTKEAFLDMCCFFAKGFPLRVAEYIVGAEEVASLQEAALITRVIGKPRYLGSFRASVDSLTLLRDEMVFYRVSEEEELLSVHDIIQPMGRNSSQSSRIMDSNSWGKIEKDEGKVKGIRGIWLNGIDCVLKRNHVNLIKDTLRILVMTGRSIGVSGTDEDVVSFPELRYMRIAGDISWMNVEALDKLGVLECEKLPGKQNGPLKLPASLRSLKVAWQPPVMQDFMPNSSLEELDITFDRHDVRDNKESSAFYSRLGGLNKLKTLRVTECLSLCGLPEDVFGLQELNRLFLTGCSNLERLSESFGQLKALRRLDLSWCTSLKELPESFSQLKALTDLDLSWCAGLEELPELFGQLKALTHLDLSWCASLEALPESFGQLKALTHLYLVGCTSLEALPCTFGGLEALQSLGLYGSQRLKKLPSEFQHLRSLTYLNLEYCDHLESDICVKDESIKIVEKSEHSCTNCWQNQKLRIDR